MLVVKVPAINGIGKTVGCELAPDKILEQLEDIYTTEEGKELKFEKEGIEIDKNNLEATNKNIFNKAREIFTKHPSSFPLFLGGDHSISCSLVKAFNSFFGNIGSGGSNTGLLILDAHADCVNRMKEPTHEDWLRNLIEDGFPTYNIILAGLRNPFKNKNEKEIGAINIFTMYEIYNNISVACDSIMEIARKFDALHLSIDIDVVDPAFAPATGYIEPAGLTSRELIYLLQRIKLLKNLKSADLVEINPTKDINNITAKLGAKIIAELI